MIKLFLLTILLGLVRAVHLNPSPKQTDSSCTVRTFYNDENGAFHIKFHRNPAKTCTILSTEWVRYYRGFKTDNLNEISVKENDATRVIEGSRHSGRGKDESKIFEIYGRREDVVKSHVERYCMEQKEFEKMSSKQGGRAEPEVRKIVDSGDQANRIDVVFMGDGYQLNEKEEFFEDMDRLAADMFEGETFKSWLPLFNIWAIFVESVDSGIGYNGPQNTPFELYREQGELRVIWPGNTDYARTICQLTGSGGCDFPSLIANDDFYGGLGGEFVVSTRSNRTGTVVLRHEMGHSFIDVGDEYDNSWAYSGVNSASSVASLGWGHWLSGTAREERAIYRVLEYPWYDLSLGSQTITFESDGTYSRWYMLASVSAAGEADSLEFELDGEILPWTSTGFDDREFYSWNGETGFSSGSHQLIVRSKTNSTNPNIPRMICSVNLHEFGSEDEFHIDNNYVSAYPTWDVDRRKALRPTNAGCLMRNMSTTTLCNICKEGMWTSFLQKVSIIDSVQLSTDEEGQTRAILFTLQIGPFRKPGNEIPGEKLQVNWFHEGIEQGEWKDQFEIIPTLLGTWRVEVIFTTPEVRLDASNLLTDGVNFVV